MKKALVLAVAIILSLITSGRLAAQDNPFAGTWKLNVAKSQYTGASAPKSETRTVVVKGDAQTSTYEGVAADGSRISYSATTHFDGKDEPYTGRQLYGADTVATKHVDANTYTGVNKKAGKVLYTATFRVSNDGKMMTQTVKGNDAQGNPVSIVAIWEKQ